MDPPIGTRVSVWRCTDGSGEQGNFFDLGYGIFIGRKDFEAVDGKGKIHDVIPNLVHIKLDNGEIIDETECHWKPLEEQLN